MLLDSACTWYPRYPKYDIDPRFASSSPGSFRVRANERTSESPTPRQILFFSFSEHSNHFAHNAHNHSFSTVHKRLSDCMTRTETAPFRGGKKKYSNTKLFPLTFRRNLFPSKLTKCIASCCNETREKFSYVNLTESMERDLLNKVERKKKKKNLE